MRFGLLGPLTVLLDAEDAPVRIEQRMPEILLSALLLNAGKPVPTAKLTAALWGYDPPPSAASSLYNHVARLRRLLGPEGGGRIRNASVGYVIDVEPDELDATEFATLCTKATGLREAGSWASASETFAAALSLWRGEPAEGVSGLDEWEAHIQELREMRLQALDARIDCDLRLGRYRQTTAELQALALEHPLHEPFHQQLMLALYRSGRQTDALNAYQRLRQSLSHELGIDPSPPVQRVHQAILGGNSQLDAVEPPAEIPAPVTAPAQQAPAENRYARQTLAAKLARVLVRIAFWLFVLITLFFVSVAIYMPFDHDPADDVSIGPVIFLWCFVLGACVLPTFLLGRRVYRYRKAISASFNP